MGKMKAMYLLNYQEVSHEALYNKRRIVGS